MSVRCIPGGAALPFVSLQFLSPQVEAFMASVPDSVPDEAHVVAFMKSLTLVGVLPVPHPIITRRYQPNQYTSLWFTTVLLGVVFLRSQGAYVCVHHASLL